MQTGIRAMHIVSEKNSERQLSKAVSRPLFLYVPTLPHAPLPVPIPLVPTAAPPRVAVAPHADADGVCLNRVPFQGLQIWENLVFYY